MKLSGMDPISAQFCGEGSLFPSGSMLQVDSYQRKILPVHRSLEWETPGFTFAFLRAGECAIHSNGKNALLQTGHLAIFPPDQKFKMESRTIEAVIELMTLKPTLAAFFLCAKYVFDENETASTFVELNTEFFDKLGNPCPGDQEQSARFSSLIFDFFYNLNQNTQFFYSDKIHSLIRRINRNPAENYSQNKLKKMYGSDFSTLARLFRKHHKCSISQYVFQTRMNLAEQLLAQKNCLIQEIARKCGYGDFSFFSREFKRIHGVPPGMFRPSSAQKVLAFSGTLPQASSREFRKLIRKSRFCEEFVYVARDYMPFFKQVFPRILHYGESKLGKGYFYESVSPFWRLGFVKDGQLVFTDKNSGKEYFITAGTLFVIKPDQSYRYEVSGHKNVKLCYIALNENIITAMMLANKIRPPFHVFFNRGDGVQRFFDEVLKIIRTKNVDKKRLLADLTYAFLLALQPSDDPEIPKLLNEIVLKIQNNISLPLKLSELASGAGCSESTVQRMFRKYLDRTPAEYISQIRMNYAETLLRCQDLSISEVAAYCGFRSFALFSKNFRQSHGCTPNSFRKKVFDTEKNHRANIKWFKHSGNDIITQEIQEEETSI